MMYNYNICIVGLSGNQSVKGVEGTGKSCLCSRFLASKYDDYRNDHITNISLSDWHSNVVNREHWLYWGSCTKRLDTTINNSLLSSSSAPSSTTTEQSFYNKISDKIINNKLQSDSNNNHIGGGGGGGGGVAVVLMIKSKLNLILSNKPSLLMMKHLLRLMIIQVQIQIIIYDVVPQ